MTLTATYGKTAREEMTSTLYWFVSTTSSNTVIKPKSALGLQSRMYSLIHSYTLLHFSVPLVSTQQMFVFNQLKQNYIVCCKIANLYICPLYFFNKNSSCFPSIKEYTSCYVQNSLRTYHISILRKTSHFPRFAIITLPSQMTIELCKKLVFKEQIIILTFKLCIFEKVQLPVQKSTKK